MKLALVTSFIFLFLFFKPLTAKIFLQCLDARGKEKNFSIFKDRKIVQFSSPSGKIWGEYLEMPGKYIFKFPKAENRSEAIVKINRYNGMMEFETGRLPFLSILWTANCTEIAR